MRNHYPPQLLLADCPSDQKKNFFKWNKEKLNPKRDASPFKIMNTLVKSSVIA